MILTLAQLKTSVGRLENDDDDQLRRTLTAAEAAVLKYLKVPALHYDVSGSNVYPDDLGEAIILFAMSLYDYPDQDPLNASAMSLLESHRYDMVL